MMSRWIMLSGVAMMLAAPGAAQAPVAVDPMFARFTGETTPGCAIAVDRDGRTVLSRGYGMADLEHGIRNTPDTVFEAGSVSKQFTAAAVLTLVDQGKLRLDTDVRTILPELPDYGRVITIDQLLNHTSGLRDWGGIAALGGWPRTTRAYRQADALAIIVRQRALNYAPGDESSYTNSGYNLLTEIVRRVSGMSLAAFSQQTFFKPLGMTHSQWRDDFRRIVPGRAQAYERDDSGYRQEMPFEDAYGNGGLLTTVGDLLLWNRALDNGALGPFVTKKLSERSTLRDGRQLTYGRGLFNFRFQGVEEIAHAGSTAGYRAWLGRYPAYRLSIALLCNASDADTGMGRKVAALFLPPHVATPVEDKTLDGLYVDQLSGMPLDLSRYRANATRRLSPDRIELTGRDDNIAIYVRTAPVDPATVRTADYAGSYRSTEVEATYDLSPAATPGTLDWRIRERPGEVHALTPIYRDAFQGNGTTVRFLRDAAGRVTGLAVSIDRARNVRFDRLR